jgi:hypothetical protein
MFAIKPPPKQPKNWDYPDLPEPVFRIAIVSPSGSGKSVLLSNVISNPSFPYRELFKKNIFLFSSTFHLTDPSFAMSDNIPKKNVFENLDIGILDEIVRDQESIITSYGKERSPHVLIVFDDVGHQINYQATQYLKGLYFSARHKKISLIFLIQAYRSLPRAMRVNCTEMVFFQIANTGERETIADEMPIDKRAFYAILDDATEEPYSFLVVFNRNPMNKRFQKRFTGEWYNYRLSHSMPRNTNGVNTREESDEKEGNHGVGLTSL